MSNSLPNERQGGNRPSFENVLQMMDTNSDKKLSKDEVKGPLSEQFSRMDVNGDGFLTQDEFEKRVSANRQRPQGQRN